MAKEQVRGGLKNELVSFFGRTTTDRSAHVSQSSRAMRSSLASIECDECKFTGQPDALPDLEGAVIADLYPRIAS